MQRSPEHLRTLAKQDKRFGVCGQIWGSQNCKCVAIHKPPLFCFDKFKNSLLVHPVRNATLARARSHSSKARKSFWGLKSNSMGLKTAKVRQFSAFNQPQKPLVLINSKTPSRFSCFTRMLRCSSERCIALGSRKPSACFWIHRNKKDGFLGPDLVVKISTLLEFLPHTLALRPQTPPLDWGGAEVVE